MAHKKVWKQLVRLQMMSTPMIHKYYKIESRQGGNISIRSNSTFAIPFITRVWLTCITTTRTLQNTAGITFHPIRFTIRTNSNPLPIANPQLPNPTVSHSATHSDSSVQRTFLTTTKQKSTENLLGRDTGNEKRVQAHVCILKEERKT
jgi:hypothetical protein